MVLWIIFDLNDNYSKVIKFTIKNVSTVKMNYVGNKDYSTLYQTQRCYIASKLAACAKLCPQVANIFSKPSNGLPVKLMLTHDDS